MGRTFDRVWLHRLLLGCAAAAVVVTSLAAPPSGPLLAIDIAPQSLNQALSAFGEQTGLQLFYVSALAKTRSSKGARAGLAPAEALAALLAGTGLTFEFVNARAVRIFAAPSASSTAPSRRAAVASGQRAGGSGENPSPTLEEVLVTANRYLQDASKVPINMVVWTADDLTASGVKSIDQIAFLTPSVQLDRFGDIGGGTLTDITIRGVSDRSTPTVGLYVDDTPIPVTGGYSYLRTFPFPFDLARIEVLRGPQLQLFGEGNQGGAVRYVFNQPSLSEFSGSTEVEIATTQRGDLSYEAGAAVGGPLIGDTLGFRVSAWGRHDGGFVDRVDPVTGATVDHDANHLSSTSARGALTLAPNDAVRITPAIMYSSFDLHDSAFFITAPTDPPNLSSGPLRNISLDRQPDDDQFYLASLHITARLGAADLSAMSAYYHHTAEYLLDLSNGIDWGGPLGPAYPAAYSDLVARQSEWRQAIFTQELRLASADPNATLTWDAAAFYSSEHIHDEDHWTSPAEAAADFGLPGAVDVQNTALETQTRLAAFGELSLRLTKRLTVEAGLHTERTHYDAVTEHPPFLSSAGSDSAVLPRFTLSYQPGERQLIYLTAARGYGTGGFWGYFAECGEPPAPIDTETLWSYEAGTKSGFLDGRLQLDAGVFHIPWNNSQSYLAMHYNSCNTIYTETPGAAVSNGFDLAAQALLSSNLKLSLAVAYTDARFAGALTENGAVITRRGEAVSLELPQVTAPWNVTAAVDYSVALPQGVSAKLRIEDIFHSRNPGPFQDDDPTSVNYYPGNRPDPSTNLVNLRATLSRASCDAALFVNNLFDSQPVILRINSGYTLPTYIATTFRPRTVGMSVSWRF
jgi:iron complex outermembrane recepter protein